jgi:hypothetical protein
MVQKSLIAVLIIALLVSLTGLANSAWRVETKATDAQLEKPLIGHSQDRDTPPDKDPGSRKPRPEFRHPWGDVLASNSPTEYKQNILEKSMDLFIVFRLANIIF